MRSSTNCVGFRPPRSMQRVVEQCEGGFWLGVPVLQRLGRLGADFICTVYLDSDDD